MQVTKRRGKQRLAAGVATSPTASASAPPIKFDTVQLPDDNVTLLRRLRWIGLAAAPSSLMLGVTTYMTTDIAAIPAFWIIPLALYLLTFIFVFARWPWVWTGTPHTVVMFLQPCLILFLVLRMVANITPTGPWANLIEMGLNLGAFFSTTLMCHGELAKDRPSTKHLTEFYFWMSFGGVLGGLFNTLFAPVVFQYGLWEYLIAMAFACLVRSNLVDEAGPLIPRDSTATRSTKIGYGLDYGVPIAIGLAAYFFIYVGETHTAGTFLFQRKYLIAALVVLVLALSLRPVRFGLSIAALFIAMIVYERRHEDFIYEGRGFFGRLRVYETVGGDHAWEQMPAMIKDQQTPYEWKVYRRLMHGGINHGMQIVQYKDDRTVFPVLGAGTVGLIAGPLSGGPYCAAALVFPDREEMVFQSLELSLRKRREPITYFYQRNGVAELYYKLCWPDAQPVAEVANMNGAADARMTAAMVGLGAGEFSTLAMLGNTQSEPPYAVIGLGTGILACYAKPYQHVDFFEIDPLVKNLSVVPGYVPKWRPDYDAASKVPDPTFYFIQDAQDRGAKIDVKLGDGRLKIKDAPQGYYHTIMLDAFSSDAIPVHLLTKDAVKLYLDKLAEGGVLIFNTTNRYVEINGVLSAIARDLDLDCLRCSDLVYGSDHPDRYSADWLVLQRKIDGDKYKNGGRPIHDRLEGSRPRLWWNGKPILKDGKPLAEERWKEVKPFPGPAWTDGYSNLLNPRVMPWLAPWRETRE